MLNKKAILILIFGIVSLLFSWVTGAGLVLAIFTLCLYAVNKTVRSDMKSEIGRTLAIIAILVNICSIFYVIVLMPLPENSAPAWLFSLRSAITSTSFYGDFENNFISEGRYIYLLKGLGVTFEVTFFAVLLGIVLGVIVALVRSSYDTLK